MTTEAQRLADLLMDTVVLDKHMMQASALLRRQEAALRQARDALENVRKYDKENLYGLDDDIATLNELLGEKA